MKSLYFLTMFIVITLDSIAFAEDNENVNYFKSLCVGEESVGFYWENNKWNYTKYKPEKYIVQKIEINDVFSNSSTCIYEIKGKWPPPFTNEDMILTYGCYNIRRLGKKFIATSSEICK